LKVASIDIGTNSVRMLMAEKEGAFYKPLKRLTEITRLGEDVNETKTLKKEAIERTLNTLLKYKQLTEKEAVDRVKVCASSVLREAKDSDVSAFQDRVRKKTGFEVEVLSGEKEAKLTHLGAVSRYMIPGFSLKGGSGTDFKKTSGKGGLIIVIDLGGGSTEFVLSENSEVKRTFSLDIGSVRLKEMFLRSDPPSEAELENLKNHVHKEIEEIVRLLRDFYAPNKVAETKGLELGPRVIGVGGTITTLSAIKHEMEAYNWKKVHGSTLTLADIEGIFRELKSRSLADRKKIVGLEPRRADVIVAGALILIEILEALNLKILTVSENDILSGLLLSL